MNDVFLGNRDWLSLSACELKTNLKLVTDDYNLSQSAELKSMAKGLV